MALTIPPEPSVISPEVPPPGWRMKLLPFNDRRRLIDPRIQLVHTNAAAGQGSIESSYNWSMRNTWDGYIHGDPQGSKYTTIPHGQVDLDGDAAILLELNRQGIVNARINPYSLGIETADRGWRTDPYPTGSYFTEPQMQKIANFFAYVHMWKKIRLAPPLTWDGNGTATHTSPFAEPYWTIYAGKTCPGLRKKDQTFRIIIPHAQRIVNAWLGTTTQVPRVMKYGGTPAANWAGWYSTDGGRTKLAISDMAGARHLTVTLKGVDAKTLQPPKDPWNWTDVSHTTSVAELNRYLCSTCAT